MTTMSKPCISCSAVSIPGRNHCPECAPRCELCGDVFDQYYQFTLDPLLGDELSLDDGTPVHLECARSSLSSDALARIHKADPDHPALEGEPYDDCPFHEPKW